ncbi:unnamed protein product, partial [Rotaria sordida]
QVVLSIERNK